MKTILLLLITITLAACSKPDAGIVSAPEPIDFKLPNDPLHSPLGGEYEKAQRYLVRGQVDKAEGSPNDTLYCLCNVDFRTN
jgi:hypothetical protein